MLELRIAMSNYVRVLCDMFKTCYDPCAARRRAARNEAGRWARWDGGREFVWHHVHIDTHVLFDLSLSIVNLFFC